MTDARADVLEHAIATFRKQKALGERAIAQVADGQLFESLDPETNSIAVLVRHLHGNMRSRWTDFLTSDGEKPDRQRDDEFIPPEDRSREAIMALWTRGWQCLFDALEALEPRHAEAKVRVRGESITVVAAIFRQIDHYAQHVGQIILLSRHFAGSSWETLSIPRGRSEEFNRAWRK
jgi:hypothetical protein